MSDGNGNGRIERAAESAILRLLARGGIVVLCTVGFPSVGFLALELYQNQIAKLAEIARDTAEIRKEIGDIGVFTAVQQEQIGGLGVEVNRLRDRYRDHEGRLIRLEAHTPGAVR